MMDFNLILLLAGLGCLALVAIVALLGFFGGLKKELKCTAIAFVLLLLALLVFGESSILLNINANLLRNFLADVPESAKTIWDYIVYVAQNNVPNGTEIFVEGSKSYAFLHDVVAGVARSVMLIAGTFVMFIIILITNGIFRLVTRIVSSCKARRRRKAGIVEEEQPDKNIQENVVVAQSSEGEIAGEVVTADKTPIKAKKSNHRGWSALIAGTRAVIAILFIFAPISGIFSVLDEITPETNQLINEALSGGLQLTDSSDTIVDMAMDVKDAYYDSALGKVVESSSFFFGESISTHLFDSAFKIETQDNDIVIRDEIIVIIDAINAFEGSLKLDEITNEQFGAALDALKNSELIVEVMPVIIEVAYELPIIDNQTVGEFLAKSGQQTAFLQLRQANWDKNIEILLDTAKEAFKLGFLKEDFNFLTMDPEVLRDTVATLTQSDVICNVLNIGIQVALQLDMVTDLFGEVPPADLSEMDWAKEFNTIVDIYASFLGLEITTLENLDVNQIVQDIVGDQAKVDIVVDIISQVLSLQLVNDIALDLAFDYIANNQLIVDAGLDQVEAVKKLAELDWQKEVVLYLEAVKLALPLLDFSEGIVPNVDLFGLDPQVLYAVVDKLFETESLEQILQIGVNVALAMPMVKDLVGQYQVEIDTSTIDWKKDFTTLVSIYEEVLKLEIKDLKSVTDDLFGFLNNVFEDDNKVDALNNVVEKLAGLAIFNQIAIPVGNNIVKEMLNSKGFSPEFIEMFDLTKYTVEQWVEDFQSLVSVADEVNDLCGFEFALESIDFSEEGFASIKEILSLVLNLNILGDDNFKNTAITEVLKIAELFDQEDIDNLDFSDVVWLEGEGNELDNLHAIIDAVYEITLLDGVNLNKLDFDFNALLNNHDFVDKVVDALDAVVESNLILEIIPAALNKFVVPMIEDLDDEDGTLKDLVGNIESEELIVEVQKLVNALHSAINLGIFNVASDGIEAINFANTEDMKVLINSIFDCALIEGYEARLIRIALKITKIFPDLESGVLEGIDFDNEQQILNDVIDALEVVLQDEEFVLFEDGKLKFDKYFYTKETTLNAALDVLDLLFGSYAKDGSTDGLQMIERLMPEVYAKFSDLIPDTFQEVMDILDLGSFDAETLTNEVRLLIYVLKVAVDIKVQSYITENDYDFTNSLEGINEILETIFALTCIEGNEGELVAWGLNYVVETAGLEFDEFTADDFKEVDWKQEVTNLQNIIDDVIRLTNINNISSINKIKDFVANQEFLSDEFLSDRNFNVVFDILEGVFSLQLVETILPVGLEYALNLAKESDLDFSFLGEDMTGEKLVEDLISIVDVARILVYELDIIEYKANDWKGDIPAVEPINKILDIIFDLNLISGKENQLIKTLVDKFLPANDFVNAKDFDFSFQYDGKADLDVIQEVLVVAFAALEANNLETIDDVLTFVNEQQFLPFENLIREENALLAADLIETISDMQLLQQALIAAINNGIELDMVKELGNFTALKELTKPELAEDLKTISKVIRGAVDANVLQYYFEQDLNPLDYEGIAQVVEIVGTLNILNKCASHILPSVLNNLVPDMLPFDYKHTFTYSDFSSIDWANEFVIIADVLVETGSFLESKNLDSLSDILQFIEGGHYTDSLIVNEENAYIALDIVDRLFDSMLISSVAATAVDFGISYAEQMNLDISFIKGRVNAITLNNDLGVIVEILRNAVDLGAVEFLLTNDLENIDLQPLVEIVALLEELNILTDNNADITALVYDIISRMFKFEYEVSVEDFKDVDFAKENQILQTVFSELNNLLQNEGLTSLDAIKSFIEEQPFLDAERYEEVITKEALSNIENILVAVLDSKILAYGFVDFFNYGIGILCNMTGFDVEFLKGSVTIEELQEDVVTIFDIVEKAIDLGALEFYFTQDLEEIDLNIVAEIIDLIASINILGNNNKEIAAFAINMVAPMLGIEETVMAKDFDDVSFANEQEVLTTIVKEAAKLLENLDLTSLQAIKDFMAEQPFLSKAHYEEIYTTENIACVENILVNIFNSDLLAAGFDYLFDFGIDKVVAMTGFDVEFLKGSVTIEELQEDVVTIFDIVEKAIDLGALEFYFTQDLEEINLQPLVEIITLIEKINLLGNNNTEITALVYNMVAPMIGIEDEATAEDFAHISYAKEAQVFRDLINEIALLLEHEGISSLADIKEFIDEQVYLTQDAYNEYAIENVQNILALIVESQFISENLVALFEFAANMVTEQGIIDLSFVEGRFTNEDLVADVHTFIAITDHILDTNIIKGIFGEDIEIDVTPVVQAIKLFEEMNLLTKCNIDIALIVYDIVLPILNIDQLVEYKEIKDIDFAEENQLLQDVVAEIGKLLENENLSTVSDIKAFINEGKYFDAEYYEQVYSKAAIKNIENILVSILSSKLIGVKFDALLNMGVDMVIDMTGFDVEFLKDSITYDELREDVSTIFAMVNHLIDFGALEFVFTQKLEVIDLDHVNAAIALLEELNILVNNNTEIAAFAYNFVASMLQIDKTVTKDDFADIDFAFENQVLRDAIYAISWIQADFALTSFDDILDFINNQEYLDIESFIPEVYNHAKDLIKAITSSKIVQFVLPEGLVIALNIASEQGFDLSFLDGKVSGEQLAADIYTLACEAIWWVQHGQILDTIETQEFTVAQVERIAKVIEILGNLNIVKGFESKYAVLVTNFVAENILNYTGRVNEYYYSDIDWSVENVKLQNIFNELADIVRTFFVENELLSVAAIQEFMASDLTAIDVNAELIRNVADVVAALADSSLVVSELVFVHEFVAAANLIDFVDLNETLVSKDQLKEDLSTIANFIYAAGDVDVYNYVLNDKPLKADYVDEFAYAVADIINLNVLSSVGFKEELLVKVFEMFNIEVSASDLNGIDWDIESVTVAELIIAAYDALMILNLDQLSDFASFNPMDLMMITDYTREYLEKGAVVLNAVSDSQLVEKLALIISEQMLNIEGFEGVADLHNIYNNGSELTSDVKNIANVLMALSTLDINGIVNDDALIPYDNMEVVSTVIRNIFSLNYLNNDGRIETLLNKFSPIDVSDFSADNVDLVSDAELIIAAYENLLPILTDPEFFFKSLSDFGSIKVYPNYWSEDVYLDALRNAVDNLFNTTLVQECAIFALAFTLPYAENYIPGLYDAIDPERLTGEQIAEDLKDIVYLAIDAIGCDIEGIMDGYYFTSEVEELVVKAINVIANLNLLDGRGAIIAETVADRFDNMNVNGFHFYADDYVLDVDYKGDAQVLITIVHEAFDLLEKENIVTLSQLMKYITNVNGLLSDATFIETLENVLRDVVEMSLIKNNLLALYVTFGQPYVESFLSENLADVSDVYANNDEFYNEIITIIDLIPMVVDLGLADIMAGENINYDQPDEVKALLNKVASLRYLNVKLVDIVEFIDGNLAIDLSTIDFEVMDIANDFSVLGDIYEQLIPVLLSENNPFTTLDAITKATINKSDLYALIYDYQSIYPSVIELISEMTIAPQLVKFAAEQVANNQTGLVASIVDALDIANMNDAEIAEDLLVVADIFRNIETLDVLRKVLYKEDIAITDNDTISALVANVFELNMVDNSFADVIETIVSEVLDLDLTSVDLSTIDVEREQEVIVEVVNKGVVVINSLEVTMLSEVKPYLSDLLNAVKADVKDSIELLKDRAFKAAIKKLVDTVLDEVRRVDLESSVEVVEALCELQLVAKLAIPAYEQIIYNKLDGILSLVGDIHNYDEDMLSEDLALFARITRKVYESGIYEVATIREMPDESSIPALKVIVRDICNLNIVNIKVRDTGDILQEVLELTGLDAALENISPEFSFADCDFNSVSMSADADIYVEMVPHGYVALKELLETGIHASYLGRTDAMKALIDIYTLSIETGLVQTIAPEVFDLISSICERLNWEVNEDDTGNLYNISEFLYGLVEIGFFSNNGIDFTKDAVIRRMVNNVYDTVTLSDSLVELIDKLVNRIYAYGVVPFTWEHVGIKHELRTAKDVLKDAVALLDEYADEIKSKDRSFLTDEYFQNDVDRIIKKLCESDVVDQLFFPLIEGTFKALTMGYTDGEMVYTATKEQVLNESLPNFWNLVDILYEMTEFKRAKLNKDIIFNFSLIADAIEIAANDIMLKDNLAKLSIVIINKFSSYDLTEAEKAALIAIDFTSEAHYYVEALDKLQVIYDTHNFSLDSDSMKKPAVLKGIADAVEVLIPSEIFKVLARTFFEIGNDKVIADFSPALADIVREYLANAAYTDDDIVNDIDILLDAARSIADANVLGNKDNIDVWNFADLRDVISAIYATELVMANEHDFSETLINELPYASEYYNDSIIINDWEAEFIALINAIEALNAKDLDTITDPFDDRIDGELMMTITQSDIICHGLVKEINRNLVAAGLPDDEIHYEDIKWVDTVEKWNKELHALEVIMDFNENIDTKTISDIVSVYDIINASHLCEIIIDASADTIVPELPIVNKYYTDEFADLMHNSGKAWHNEFDDVVNVFRLLEDDHIDILENPLASASEIDAEIMVAITKSLLLSNAVTMEINDNLEQHGLTEYQITIDEVRSITTKEEWDKELEALRDLVELSENPGGVNRSTIVSIVETIRDTTLCNKVLSKATPRIVKELPIIKEYPDAYADITTEDEWNAEFDAIVNALEVIPSDITTVEKPIEKLNGQIMVAAFESKILTNAVTNEFNANLAVLGFTYTVDKATLLGVGSAEQWDKELAAIKDTKTMLDNLATTSLYEVKALYDRVVAETVLAESILAKALEDEGIKDIIESL